MSDTTSTPLRKVGIPHHQMERRRLGLLSWRQSVLWWLWWLGRRRPSRSLLLLLLLLSRGIFLRLPMSLLSLRAVPHQEHDGGDERQDQETLEYPI